MNKERLVNILKAHALWLANDPKGSRAYLSGADLSGAYLSGADLSRADLLRANLSEANLSRADLLRANLSRANLSRADLSGTILDGINWLAYIGIIPTGNRARAYKLTNSKCEGPFNGGITYKVGESVIATLDPDIKVECSKGINLATFAWCLNALKEAGENPHLFLMEFDASPKNVCVPMGSDGKFRVGKAQVIGECDLKGNLKKEAR